MRRQAQDSYQVLYSRFQMPSEIYLSLMKALFIRREDYWIYPLSTLGMLLVASMLYAGAIQLRLLTGLAGFSILYFMTYIIRKNYSKRLAALYLLGHLLASIAFALAAYYLTN